MTGIPITISVVPATLILQNMYASHLRAMQIDEQSWGWFGNFSRGVEQIIKSVMATPSVRVSTEKHE